MLPSDSKSLSIALLAVFVGLSALNAFGAVIGILTIMDPPKDWNLWRSGNWSLGQVISAVAVTVCLFVGSQFVPLLRHIWPRALICVSLALHGVVNGLGWPLWLALILFIPGLLMLGGNTIAVSLVTVANYFELFVSSRGKVCPFTERRLSLDGLNRQFGLPPAGLLLWLAPAALLMIALLPLPYDFYTLLRIVVSGCAAFITVKAFRQGNETVLIYVAIAALFNPIAPVRLDRSEWAVLDVICAAWFLKHLHWMVYPASFPPYWPKEWKPQSPSSPLHPSPTREGPTAQLSTMDERENGQVPSIKPQHAEISLPTKALPVRPFRQIIADQKRTSGHS